ncbi:hypothetical protein [Herbidospora sp. NBRC 101105]|uniref:hypothetical protein n=1 Tax=Herbidospora sp. NBRC 101105 TaxID=3032195 RepID=UPI0024A088FD|nr:hypothetical protein [Herbidospora sp. NBRC 101105]GLX99358.1 hypothetical protein Hesp01_73080 [Herbidospora sp. NBRC 101105]
MAKRGISLLDLAAPFAGAGALIPAGLAARLENLAVVSHRATTSAGVITHSGVVQPLADLGFPALRTWEVEVPGLNTGLPFHLVRRRAQRGAGQNLEPAGEAVFLDLVVDRIAIKVPGLRPATLVPSAAAVAAHLLPDPARSGVRIVGSGVVRIDLSGSGEVVRFVDWPDPFDPDAPSGAVYRLSFDPVSFFIGGSDIGMTVDRLVFDASAQVTPPEIVARGQTPGWQGISIAEATLFLPPNTPLVDKVNIGVRDVLLGSPAGLQGEIRVELGRTPINAAAVDFLQDFAGAEQARPVQGSGRELTVPFLTGTPATGRMRARLNPSAVGAATQPRMVWTLPDGTRVSANDSGWFTTSVGETMHGTFSEEVSGERVSDAPTAYTFVQSEPTVRHPAKVNVRVGSVNLANVVFVSGTAEALRLLEFESALNPADAARLQWRHGEGTDAHTRTGPDFSLFPSREPGTSFIVVTDPDKRTRRIRVDVLSEGRLLVGTAQGVFDGAGNPVKVRAVGQTYRLSGFLKDAALTPFPERATLAGNTVTVPDGGLAEVTVELGSGTRPDAPPPPVVEKEIRRLRILFKFETSDPTVFNEYLPRDQEDPGREAIRRWAGFFQNTTFVVIGRACDIGAPETNKVLARNRATAVAGWLSGLGTVHARGEQDPPSPAMQQAQEQIPGLSDEEKSAAHLITKEHSATTRGSWGQTVANEIRERYRRIDVYAVGGTYTPPGGADPAGQRQPTDTQEHAPDLRRAYLPGADVTEVTPAPPRDPRLAWLVRLLVRWDSPTVTAWADAIPTQAEFTFQWATANVVTLPAPGGGETTLPVRAPSEPKGQPSTEVYTLTGRWTHDSRSGQTVFSLGIASSGDPKGLAAVDSEFLAVALALAPALLAGIGAAGVDGQVVRLAALAVAAGALAAVAENGEVVIHSAEVEHRQRGLTDATGLRTRVLLDYTASLELDLDAGGLGRARTKDSTLKVRYKKVGLEFDDAKTAWYEKVGLVYDDASFELADPGRWQIDGPLGQLLQVTGTRAGFGSSWFELDLEFALDLGIVSVQGATVRFVFGDDGISAELRGLAVGVDIPGVLRGEGRLVVGDGGAFQAALELELVSVGVKAMGTLAFDPATDFVSISLGLLLPVGIPLGATGLGVFGFVGQFVANGARALPSGFPNDPVGRELAWYRNVPAESKFAPARGQWAVGLGMIVGTLPDTAFTFNATGMFVVAFPDPAVIFGIDAKLVRKPPAKPSAKGDPPSPSLNVVGLIAVDDEAVLIGVRGRYTIPKVLELLVPIDGYFPYPSVPKKDAYLRIGSDGVVSENRPGDPVTVKLLPGTLNASAFAYLMVEQRRLHRLGGDPDFNFDGFSVGFGAGWQIKWSAGPIKLTASAKLLVGFGTNPFLLKGGIFVKGELSLVVVKVAASGEIVATVWDDNGTLKVNLKGRFCGSVSMFFFSLKGCVGIDIGDPITPKAPPPPAPIGKVSLTDRRGFTTATAVAGAPGPEQTVWPDTVPVIEFTHHVAVALAGSAFAPGPGPAGPLWSGTSELKYAYRLTRVEIIPDGGAALPGPLDSGWWLPTHRPGVLAEGDVAVSESEGMFLALLAWDPAPWTYWLADGGAGTDADPSQTPGRLCDPPPRPRSNCAPGKGGVRTGPDTVRFTTPDPGSPPFPSRFAAEGQELLYGLPIAAAPPHLAAKGEALTPGAVGPGPFEEDVWWLAAATRHGFTVRTSELHARLVPELTGGELLLVVCRDFRERPPKDGEDRDGGEGGRLPVVLGVTAEGPELEWAPTVLREVRTRDGACALVRYTAPPKTTWSAVRVLEWPGTDDNDADRVGVARLCGVSAAAAAQADANAAFLQGLRDQINLRAAQAVPAHRHLLEPGRGYTVRISWQWQGWVKSDAQPAPPATPAAGGWQNGPAQSYRFRTAAAAVTTGAPPAELTDERAFDPRSLLRYLIAFEPETNSAPHLRDDPLLVHLAIDHGEQLAGRYGRTLAVRLRRTDPPPGSMAGQAHAPDEPAEVVWGPLFDAYRPLGQRLFLEAIREAPCLEEPPLGGTTGEIHADLVPGGWYDLMLMATPAGQPDAEQVVVSRTHFQASRHRGPADLLAALGFTAPDPEPFIAPDAVVTAAIPPGPPTVGDGDLDALLRGAGLDPWPLSDRARTSVLWLDAGGTWQVAGLLLEGPEAVVRTGRTALAVTACDYGGVAMSVRCRNTAGTRVLLTPAAPVAVPAAETITLTLTRTATSRTGTVTATTVTGRRFALAVPRSVRMEAGA